MQQHWPYHRQQKVRLCQWSFDPRSCSKSRTPYCQVDAVSKWTPHCGCNPATENTTKLICTQIWSVIRFLQHVLWTVNKDHNASLCYTLLVWRVWLYSSGKLDFSAAQEYYISRWCKRLIQQWDSNARSLVHCLNRLKCISNNWLEIVQYA